MRAHRTDIVSLGFGLVFVALAAWWLLARLLGLALPAVGWFLAGGLILIGVLGLAGALRSGRADRAAGAEGTDPADGGRPGRPVARDAERAGEPGSGATGPAGDGEFDEDPTFPLTETGAGAGPSGNGEGRNG